MDHFVIKPRSGFEALECPLRDWGLIGHTLTNWWESLLSKALSTSATSAVAVNGLKFCELGVATVETLGVTAVQETV